MTIALFSYGQTSHLDSLLEKGNALLYENPKEAIALVEPVLLSGDEDQIFEACNLMGDCHYFLGELDEAMNFYQRCLKIGEPIWMTIK